MWILCVLPYYQGKACPMSGKVTEWRKTEKSVFGEDSF